MYRFPSHKRAALHDVAVLRLRGRTPDRRAGRIGSAAVRAHALTLLSRLLSTSASIDEKRPATLTVSQLRAMIHALLPPRPP
jgi:hypothetical protein